jgi:hypothetical protein
MKPARPDPTRIRPAALATLALAVASLTLAGCSGLYILPQRPARPLTATSFPTTIQAAEKNVRSVHEHIVTQTGKKTSTIDADVVVNPQNQPSVRETISSTGQPKTEVIYVGGVFYVNAGATTHNTWLTIDPKDPSNPLGSAAAELLPSITQADPSQSASLQKTAIAYVQVSGNPVTLDQEHTTPYMVAINTTAALGQLGTLGQAIANSLPAQLDYDWWIGDDGLPRRYTVVVTGMNQDALFTDWNKPIHITAPGPGTVTAAKE